MSFQRIKGIIQNFIVNKKIKSSLSNLNSFCKLSAAASMPKHYRKLFFGRAVPFASYRLKGSLTIEASIALPVFTFICICMIFFCQIFMIHSEVQGSLFRAARYISGNLMLVQVGFENNLMTNETAEKVICVASAGQKVKEYSKEFLDECICLEHGADDLQFWYSTVSDEYVDLIVNYRVRLPFAFGLGASFPIVQRCRMRTWTGMSGEESAQVQDMVYITNHASVYHVSEQCTHLKLTISQIPISQLEHVRNIHGGKYSACSNCVGNQSAENSVYIAEDGDKYHNRIDCGGLKRYIQKITMEEAKGMQPCMRCGK